MTRGFWKNPKRWLCGHPGPWSKSGGLTRNQHTGGAVQVNIAQLDRLATSTSSSATPITFLTITSSQFTPRYMTPTATPRASGAANTDRYKDRRSAPLADHPARSLKSGDRRTESCRSSCTPDTTPDRARRPAPGHSAYPARHHPERCRLPWSCRPLRCRSVACHPRSQSARSQPQTV